MRSFRSVAADLLASVWVPFIALWAYELSNWAVLGVQGNAATFNLSGPLPTGVVGVASGALSPWTKPIQVVLAVLLMAPLRFAFSRKGFYVASTTVLAMAGVFVASSYWEMLSLLAYLPVEIHEGLFSLGTAGLVLLLLRGAPPPRQARSPRSPPTPGRF